MSLRERGGIGFDVRLRLIRRGSAWKEKIEREREAAEDSGYEGEAKEPARNERDATRSSLRIERTKRIEARYMDIQVNLTTEPLFSRSTKEERQTVRTSAPAAWRGGAARNSQKSTSSTKRRPNPSPP